MGVDRHNALVGYVWSWLENQVMAALKAVPLGQSAGQRLLAELAGNVAQIARSATTLADDDLSNFAPGLAIASCRHETQYSRLFRS
jgi:urease accessory protein